MLCDDSHNPVFGQVQHVGAGGGVAGEPAGVWGPGRAQPPRLARHTGVHVCLANDTMGRLNV